MKEYYDVEADAYLYNNVITEDCDVEDLELLDERLCDIYTLELYRDSNNQEENFNILYEFILSNEEFFDFDLDELENYDAYEKEDFMIEYEDVVLRELEKSCEYRDMSNHHLYLEYENIITKNLTEEYEEDDDWD